MSLYLQSEERGTPSRRSKSEGPPVVPNGRAYPVATEIDGTARKQVHNCQLPAQCSVLDIKDDR